ncbi:uncharacterized protein Dwil_GK20658 [Drosophila willistoni]|uniref:Uncharacterized protein n=1 Tax=Drosophila willistoni TaxID=7260 RepID=B4MK81_DROWI|nr:PR domain zinc finger protein 5 [Drosophila willistoni]EDW72520.2 uncharacterized protein Dwil_GK20658 [Drosophila willistoni]
METALTNGNANATTEEAAAAETQGATNVASDAVGGIIEYLEEGEASAEDEPMGEVEYLEDEIPEEEVPRLINETNKEISSKNTKDDKTDAKGKSTVTESDKPVESTDGEALEESTQEQPVETTKEKEITTEEDEENHEDDADAEENAEEAEDGEEGEEEEQQQDEEGDEAEDEADEEAELILGDEPTAKDDNQPSPESKSATETKQKKEEEPVDENQCRVCTTKDTEQLVSLFKKSLIPPATQTPAELLLVICPNLSIALKDFMPQFICRHCLATLNMAIKLKTQLETTEKDLRKRLSRSKNKVRRPRGYVVIDAPVSSSASDEEEEDDVEFKVSDVANSSSADSDSADSDISEKRKRAPGRPGRPKKRQADDDAGSGGSVGKKKNLGSSQGPFECDFCDMSFPRKQSWVLHRKTHISHRNEFYCQICNKRFKVQKAYKTHMERHDQERSQFRCELCSQIFKMRSELKRHMAIKHDEHGVIYECKRCQRTFLTQQRLQRHQSTMCTRYPPQESKSTNQYYHEQQQQQQRHHQQQQQKHHYQQQAHSKRGENTSSQGRDLFKSVAPLTTTYWSDSFSD